MDRMTRVREILNRVVLTNVLPSQDAFADRLASETRLRIYLGADPTGSSLHLSHAKNYMLLEDFRRLGHEVVVLFGDFTARIGDPTDRDSARSRLTAEQVNANIEALIKQIRPLLGFDDPVNPPKVVRNSSWLSSLSIEDIVDLMAEISVQRMLERDMFQRRLAAERPIFCHEFLYPLLQGFDSVALEVDVEL